MATISLLLSILAMVSFTHCQDLNYSTGHELRPLVMDTVRTVNFTWNVYIPGWNDGGLCNLSMNMEDRWVAIILQHNPTTFDCSAERITGSFISYGEFLGLTYLEVWATTPDEKETLIDGSFLIAVVLGEKSIDVIFTVVLSLLLVMNNFGFGCRLKYEVVRGIFSKPLLLSLGLCTQLIFMPLYCWCLAKLVQIGDLFHPTVLLGLISVGAAPSGGNSNIWSFLLGGVLELSLTFTFLNNVFAIGTMPFWMWALGTEYAGQADVDVPYANIFIALAILLGPLMLGLLLQKFRPKYAQIVARGVGPMSILLILGLLVTGLLRYWYVFFILEWQTFLASCAIPYGGMIFAGLIAKLLRQDWAHIKTWALECGYRNSSISLLIMTTAFVRPEADLASIIPVFIYICTPIPVGLYAIYYYGRRFREKQRAAEQKQEELEMEGQEQHDVAKGDRNDLITDNKEPASFTNYGFAPEFVERTVGDIIEDALNVPYDNIIVNDSNEFKVSKNSLKKRETGNTIICKDGKNEDIAKKESQQKKSIGYSSFRNSPSSENITDESEARGGGVHDLEMNSEHKSKHNLNNDTGISIKTKNLTAKETDDENASPADKRQGSFCYANLTNSPSSEEITEGDANN